MVEDVQHAIVAFVVFWIRFSYLLQKSHLNCGVLDLLLNVLTYLRCIDLFLVSQVGTSDNLTEFALIDCIENLEAIA